MKKLLLDQDSTLSKICLKNIIIPILIGIIIFFASCEQNSIEKINTITSQLNAPNVSILNTVIIYSEGALIKIKITTPELNRYLNIEKPYTEFPKGLLVEFYDSLQNPSSFIKANYCIYDEKEQLWTAENDVVAVSDKGDTLNTEYLIWDQKIDKVYSDRYVRITNKDGIMHGKGFEANQNLSNWKIKQTSGVIKVDNEK